MAEESGTWNRHLHSATHPETAAGEILGGASVAMLTIACHSDPERVGEMAALPGLLDGEAVRLSRLEPKLAPPRRGRARPLADPRLSRKPLVLSGHDGTVEIAADGSRPHVQVDGQPLSGPRRLAGTELARGVVLMLARRVVLVLRVGKPVSPNAEIRGLVGESAAMIAIRRTIRQVAGTRHPVSLRGESGTGKEIVARAIHDAGPWREGPYVAVNLGAIAPELAVAELFGAAKGAYTGAYQHRRGYFQRADGGTLFLDELGEARRDVQASLLRVLETGEVQPAGAEKPQTVNARVISATDADLETAVANGGFRSSLFHRLRGHPIDLPPLCERREDFGRLFFHFLHQELTALGEPERLRAPAAGERPWVPAELVASLMLYRWPGNVRELLNVVRQLVVASRGMPEMRGEAEIGRLLVPSAKIREKAAPPEDENLSRPSYRRSWEVSEEELLAALGAEAWTVTRAAERLGISRPALYGLMERAQLPRASDLGAEEIRAAAEQFRTDIDAMANSLKVSPRGLQLRMKKLGLRA